ncbi:retrovirus-related pol polyprotein from transposon TNT 1-94 [Tanacetum coccineum]|uniref:Retrovirus-related pol polyprotein from transposon TNT 1-94 n=1 Tax=Tanacetum coccineum TaxID=301880 RepID=A0ABQ5F3X7_9ASTR
MIDSQMDDMIKEKLALKEQVDSLEQNLSKQIKEKECLLQTFTIFKSESKEKEDKYMENEIDLEKKIKELDNFLFKVGQSAQTEHMLTKPQAFYDNIQKQALGYQDSFYLRKAQRIKPILLSDDIGKCFTPQQELSAEQVFWLRMSNLTSLPSDASPVKIEAPKELPKVSLVNESLKKLKFHLARFDNVVKIRTTPDARIEDLINEIMEVKTVFDQMDAAVQQSSVDKQCLEIAKKELLLENDRLLQKIMSQEVLLTVMNSMSLLSEYVNIDGKRKESCNLEAELLKSQNAFNDLLKSRTKAKAEQTLDKELDFACKNAKRIQELLVYVRDTCPNAINLSAKKVAITPQKNKKSKFDSVHDMCLLDFVENVMPLKKTTSDSVETQKPELKVYSRKPKNVKNVGSSKKAKIVESKNVNHSEPNHTWGSIATDIPSSSSLVMDKDCPEFLFWNRSQLMNFVSKFLGTVIFENDNIARIIGYGDYQLRNVSISRKDRMCSACALGKSKKSFHQPKAEDTNQEKLYLLHMDLCGPMLIASISGKRYILVIVDDYSRFTWVRFLRTKDEAPEAIIESIKNIQVRLNATVRNVRGTEFVNQTLCEFYENVDISHQTSVARTPHQNGVVERRNQNPIEAARTMLIFSKAPLFLWAEAINTACYTQNHSIIHHRYNKTPYELMQDKKPDLSFFHVFGALCYLTNDNDDLGKLDAKADIGIFVGYAPAKKVVTNIH